MTEERVYRVLRILLWHILAPAIVAAVILHFWQ